jgi:hypothetical protein
VLFLLLAVAASANAYSVLTHEQIVDLVWLDHMRPLLLKRFPGANGEQLRQAHAFAYGGCLIQDMGYYPFGNKDFSDLTHYVRSGDFVMNLLKEAHDINEFAFALGALAHYVADLTGHPAVNQAVAIRFPKLKSKFGPSVTYAEDPAEHIRTEFGFDVVQVAKNRYTSDAYHDFIGFEVAKDQLDRAFLDTYGIEMADIFNSQDRSVGSYRHAVSKMIPSLTRAALVTRRERMMKEDPTFSKQKFMYYLSRSQYERNWGNDYQHIGFRARVLAFFIKILPKIGPLRAAKITDPTPQTEDMYLKSVDQTIEHMAAALKDVQAGTLKLEDRDFDTGKITAPGEYKLTDEAFAMLLHKLAKRNFDHLTPELRANILQFYGDPSANLETKRHKDDWKELEANLERLKAAQVSSQH